MRQDRARRRTTWDRILAGAAIATGVGALAWGASLEIEASPLQSRLFTKLASGFTYQMEPGPNPALRFPESGPYDERLGYARMPAFLAALQDKGFVIAQQARMSPDLARFIDNGGFAVFREKAQAGLTLTDRSGAVLYQSRHPERIFADFMSIPQLIVDTLLFVENRELLDGRYPTRNPAVEWDRFAAAAANVVTGQFDGEARRFGGSTLATQIEKYRHSSQGRTNGVEDKLRQITTASVRAYQGGPDTTLARERIVVDYLNSTPLSARTGFGEVIGLGDGLWAWYGTDLDAATRLLHGLNNGEAERQQAAVVYKQVLSLLLAQRRPSHYLLSGRQDLNALANTYLRLMARDELISPELRDLAIAAPLEFRQDSPQDSPIAIENSYLDRKATNVMRVHLASLLKVPQFYELDRLDVNARATLDREAQRQVVKTLQLLTDDGEAARLGLVGERLLSKGDAAGVIYSVTLYERGAHVNYLRVQADNLDQALDLNEGGKFDLGSTAKLRTLVTYLEIIADLHAHYALLSRSELTTTAEQAADPLRKWAATYLASTTERQLQPMLDAAMERKYSASTGEAFFTGRGLHVFANFDKTFNRRIMPVREAFRHSVNLVFIRMMRDIIRYYQAEGPEPAKAILADRTHPARRAYLERFADMEGKVFLNRFYRRYHGRSPQDALAKLAARGKPVAHRLATLYRSVRPDDDFAAFRTFMQTRLPDAALSEADLLKLYIRYGPDRFSLHDRGYIARVHPLELWVVRYLQDHPRAPRADLIQASAEARQEVYTWLFKSTRKQTVDRRIRIMLEDDAFDRLHQDWVRVGYPFPSLVPSYATAIGSSADRPASLAELMGIILNDGVRQPTVRIDDIVLGEGTPYETHLERTAQKGERVFPVEVAATLRRALADVVANGTARRAYDAFQDAGGRLLPVGGKTGTGDELADTVHTKNRDVSRSAAFAFYIGDQFFGVITAHVPGDQARHYKFTSALPTQVFKVLAPALSPLLKRSPVTSPAPIKVVATAQPTVH